MLGKKAGEKYYFIAALVLGILILAIGLYFIFNELFAQEELDWEVCRQSVVLRQSMPDDILLDRVKSQFPLRCKTQVVELNWDDYKDYNQNVLALQKEIADLMVQCWYLYGEGGFHLFPKNLLAGQKTCTICFRVSFSQEIVDIFSESVEPFNKLNVGEYLASHDRLGGKLDIQWDGEKWISPSNSLAHYLRYRTFTSFKFLTLDQFKDGEYGMPALVDPSNGDLLIGTYFYSNNELEREGVTEYGYSYPFYAQPDVDDLACDIKTIPA